MTSLDRIRRDLEEQRRELLDQLAAVDGAIASLAAVGAGATVSTPREADEPAEADTDTAVPVRVKPRRVLSESHKQKLSAGRRRSREVKDAASGVAREMPGDSFVPAIGKRGERQAPRLVKRPTGK